MPTARLTDLTVRSLPAGTHFDETTPAIGIRVGEHRRTWIVMRGRERRNLLPPMLIAKYENDAFWRDPARNPNKVKVV